MDGFKKVAEKISGQFFGNHSLSNMNHPLECLVCNDTGTDLTEKGGRLCECVKEKDRQKRIARKAELLARIPALYQGVTLAGLQPRDDLHRDQSRFIAVMQEHPFDNYYFCGANDTGKTHLMWALYENAVSAGRIVLATTLFDLLSEIKRSFDGNRESAALLLIENLHTHGVIANGEGRQVTALIDDIDKARPTEFAAEVFFSLIDALYRYNHQIVVTSQLDPEKRIAGRDSLIEHFEKADARYAVGIVRRIVNDQTRIVRMF